MRLSFGVQADHIRWDSVSLNGQSHDLEALLDNAAMQRQGEWQLTCKPPDTPVSLMQVSSSGSLDKALNSTTCMRVGIFHSALWRRQ